MQSLVQGMDLALAHVRGHSRTGSDNLKMNISISMQLEQPSHLTKLHGLDFLYRLPWSGICDLRGTSNSAKENIIIQGD